MTPNNIAGMAALKGLNLLALTDHNTAKNCPAFFEACRRQGIVPIAGMELTTAEDIHIVCLFETLEAALAFDAFVDGKRVKIKNRTDIFGEQIICNGNDEPLGQEAYLLSNATELPLEAAVESARAHGAVVYPAHVDRQAKRNPDDAGRTSPLPRVHGRGVPRRAAGLRPCVKRTRRSPDWKRWSARTRTTSGTSTRPSISSFLTTSPIPPRWSGAARWRSWRDGGAA